MVVFFAEVVFAVVFLLLVVDFLVLVVDFLVLVVNFLVLVVSFLLEEVVLALVLSVEVVFALLLRVAVEVALPAVVGCAEFNLEMIEEAIDEVLEGSTMEEVAVACFRVGSAEKIWLKLRPWASTWERAASTGKIARENRMMA